MLARDCASQKGLRVKHIAYALVASLIAFTALAMAVNPEFKQIVVVSLGPLPISIFDTLLVLATAAFFYYVSLHVPTDPAPGNRAALRLTGAYVLYQVVVVLPVAVLLYDVGPGRAYGGLTARLGLLLVPFFYFVGLRHMKPEKMIALANAAALGLLLYALHRYAFVGVVGSWDGGVYRLRVLWGGSTLLFGWLAITGIFLEKSAPRAYALGMAGLLGIVLVNHRSGYLAMGLALAAYVLLSRGITRRVVAVAVAALVGGILVASVSPTIKESAAYSLTTMLNARSDANAWDRVERSQLAWDYVRVHPLGDYVWTGKYYLVNLGKEGFEPHNFVIGALDKQGWVSAGLLFALIAVVLWVGWTTRRRSRLGRVMTMYLVFYLGFCLFNTNFETTENVALFALAVAMILHANRISGEDGEAAIGAPAPSVAAGARAGERPEA